MKKIFIVILLTVISCADMKNTSSKETRTIIDGAGRKVAIPKKVTRLITIDRGFSPQVLKALNKEELLVATGGVHPKSGPYTTSKSDSFFLVPSLLNIPTVGWAGYGNYDFEKILEVNPDVIAMVAYNGLADNSYQSELLNRLEQEFNIPVVILQDYSANIGLKSIDVYFENIKLLGQITDASEQADKLVEKLSKQLEKAKSFIKPNQQERVLFLGVTDTDTGSGYVHGKDYGGAALTTELLNIKNVLTNSAVPIFGAEHILEFNPDVIVLLDAPGAEKGIKIYTENTVFQNITAVKNNRIYFTGQLQWWGDSKLMFPLQLLLFSAIYYQPEAYDLETLYTDYITDIFERSPEDIKKLSEIHQLNSLFES